MTLVWLGAAGMTWVKKQHKWNPGDPPEAVAGLINEAHASGMKILLSIPGQLYPSSIDFEAYTTFLGGVAALGPDAIEVWNEMNIEREWPLGQIDPASYVNNMLRPAYQKIKAANPNVTIKPEPTDWGSYWDKLATMTAGNNTPDVIQMDEKYIAEYGSKGVLLDLEKAGVKTDGFAPGTIDLGRVKGKLFGGVEWWMAAVRLHGNMQNICQCILCCIRQHD